MQALPLASCFPAFPFTSFGWSLVVQGGASYMNDVVTWGCSTSYWKPFDKILATINTMIVGVVVGHHHVGYATFPPVCFDPFFRSSTSALLTASMALLQVLSAVLSLGLAVALYCKWRSSAALHANNCKEFMWWHSGWHYTLPLSASAALLTL